MSKSHVTFLDVNANINIILIHIVMNVKITLSMIEDQSINSDSSLLSDHANLGDRLQVTASGLLAPDWFVWTNPGPMCRSQPRPSNCVQVFLPLLAPSPSTLSSTLTQQQTTGAAAHPAPSTASSSPACTSQCDTLELGPGNRNQSNPATARI